MKTNNGHSCTGAGVSPREKVAHEAEVESFQDLFFAKFEAVWTEMNFVKKLAKIPGPEADRLLLYWIFCFAAESSIEAGQVKEDFLESVTEAFDESLEEAEDNEEDDDGPIPALEYVKPAVMDPKLVNQLVNNPLYTKDDSNEGPV